MSKKTDADKALAELYEEHTGLTSGPVIKALNEMNDKLGITDPYCRPFKNLSEHYIDDIPPGGYGVRTKAWGGGKYLKPVKIIKNEKEANADG